MMHVREFFRSFFVTTLLWGSLYWLAILVFPEAA